MDDVNKINTEATDEKSLALKEVSPIVSELLSKNLETLEEAKNFSYDLEKEFAKTKRNKPYRIIIMILLSVLLVTGITYWAGKFLNEQSKNITLDIADFEDINLKNILDLATKTQDSLNQASKKLAVLEGSLKTELENEDIVLKNKLATINASLNNDYEKSLNRKDARNASEKRRQAINKKYAEEINILRAEVKTLQDQIAKFDATRVEESSKQQLLLNSQEQLFEREKKKIQEENATMIADLKATMEQMKIDTDRLLQETLAQVSSSYSAKLSSLDPAFSDAKADSILVSIAKELKTESLKKTDTTNSSLPTESKTENKTDVDNLANEKSIASVASESADFIANAETSTENLASEENPNVRGLLLEESQSHSSNLVDQAEPLPTEANLQEEQIVLTDTEVNAENSTTDMQSVPLDIASTETLQVEPISENVNHVLPNEHVAEEDSKNNAIAADFLTTNEESTTQPPVELATTETMSEVVPNGVPEGITELALTDKGDLSSVEYADKDITNASVGTILEEENTQTLVAVQDKTSKATTQKNTIRRDFENARYLLSKLQTIPFENGASSYLFGISQIVTHMQSQAESIITEKEKTLSQQTVAIKTQSKTIDTLQQGFFKLIRNNSCAGMILAVEDNTTVTVLLLPEAEVNATGTEFSILNAKNRKIGTLSLFQKVDNFTYTAQVLEFSDRETLQETLMIEND